MTQQIDCADWIFIIHAVIQPKSKQPAIRVQIPDLLPLFSLFNIDTINTSMFLAYSLLIYILEDVPHEHHALFTIYTQNSQEKV